jgi:hypothetical protein
MLVARTPPTAKTTTLRQECFVALGMFRRNAAGVRLILSRGAWAIVGVPANNLPRVKI